MLKDAEVAPAGTVTVGGTVAGLTDDSCTSAPPVGAAPLKVTVPVDELPAFTVDGLSVSEVTPTVTPGFTVTLALAVDEPNAAVMVADVVCVTGKAPNENSPCVDPDDTMTFGGRLIAGLFADRVTSTWPAGAGAVRLTKPTPPWLPVSVLTFSVIDASDTAEPLIVNGLDNTTSSYAALTFTVVVAGTFCTFMPKVALDAPTGTTMSGDRPIAGLLVESRTVAPLVDGAGVAGIAPLKVIVPVTLAPPVAVAALSVSPVIRTPDVFKLRTAYGAPAAAMAAFSASGTGEVAIVKVADVAPAGTVMLAGTAANSGYWLDNGTTVPPAGAGPDSVTVAVTGLPPVTVSGVNVSDDGFTLAGGPTVTLLFDPMPLMVARMLTGTGVDTGLVLIGKFALMAPAGTVAVAGTASGIVVRLKPRPSFASRSTTTPPAGAALVRCSTPSGDCPPVTVTG